MDDVEQAREAEERRRDLAANGLPVDAPYGRVVLTGTEAGTVRYEFAQVLPDGRLRPFDVLVGQAPGAWERAYVVTIYGLFGPAPARVLALPPLTDVQLRQWHFGTAEDAAAGRGAVPIVLLRGLVRYQAAALHAELRWHPDGGESLRLVDPGLPGPAPRRTDEDWLLAWRGVALLREVVGGGRDALDPEQVRDELYHHYYALLDAGERPTEEALAAALALSVSRIQARKRVLKAARIPFPPPPRPRARG